MNKRGILFDLLVLILLSLIPLLWLPKDYILTGHDSGYPINVIEAYKNRLFTWNAQDNLGRDNTTSIGTVPILSIQVIATAAGLDVRSSEIVTFVFWFLCMELAMYVFARSLLDVFHFEKFPLLASIVYSINYYLLALWRYGAATTFSAFAALPLISLFYISLLRNKISYLQASIYIGLISVLFNGGGGLSLPLFGGLLITLIWASIFFVLIAPKQDRKKSIVQIFKCVVLTSCVVLLVNAYWFLPFLAYVISHFNQNLADAGGVKSVINWTDSVSKFTSTINLFRLQGFPDWYNNPYHPYSNSILQKPLFILISFIFAPFSYLSLLLPIRKEAKKVILFFVILSLIAILFAAGVHQPTGWIFTQLMYIVPGFVVFRSAQYKFIPALYFSFAILLSYVICYLIYEGALLKRLKSNLHPKYIVLSIFLFCVLILGYHYPFFQREFFYYTKNLSTLLKVPDYIHAYDEWLKSYPNNNSRILILPRYNSSWKAGVYEWNYFSLYSPFNLIRTRPFVQYSYFLNEAQLTLFNRLTDEIRTNGPKKDLLQNLFNATHILWAGDTKSTTDDMPSENPEIYVQPLSNIARYKQVWQKDKWLIYKFQHETDMGTFFGLQSLTKYKGPNNEVIAPILLNSNNFYLEKLLGTKYDNARFDGLPITNEIVASPCMSCILESPTEEVLPTYTNILPGSIFYRLKRYRENKQFPITGDIKAQIASRLGLSLKRLSEVSSMITNSVKDQDVLRATQELSAHWDYIKMFTDDQEQMAADIGLIRVIKNYVVSENIIIEKDRDRAGSSDVKKSLNDLHLTMSIVINSIKSFEDFYLDKYQYAVPDGFTKGEIFLDALGLPTDSVGSKIFPDMVSVDGTSYALRPNEQEEKISLGIFDLQDKKNVFLHFPKLDSLISSFRPISVNTGDIKNSCVAGSISGFGNANRYALEINGANALPEQAAFYLSRENPSYPTQVLREDMNVPNFAFSFSRKNTGTQKIYFTAGDGDVGATLLMCVSAQLNPFDYISKIRVIPIRVPGVYFTKNLESFSKVIPYSFTKIDDTKYEVVMPFDNTSSVLVFNENFDKQWKLYPATKSKNSLVQFVQTWFKKSIATETHFSIYGFANAWYTKSPLKGTYIIEYFPQTLFYQGLILSILTLIGLIIMGIYLYKRNNNL